ncbi:MAG TPA: SpoIIE family protein phosphatase, partial [Miltoncostaeaceae bacterium]|nr:SpoIIE family protein phosphatase [Miltoncostaeaceae bacterium]
GEHLVIHRDFAAGVPSAAGRHRLDGYGVDVVEALRAGRTLVVDDVAADASLTASQRAAFAAVAVGAHLAVPRVRSGRLIALLGVAQDAPRAWTDDEVALVEEVAERTWAAVERARSETALRESEERFRLLADNAPDLIWLNDAANQAEFMNAAYVEFLGRPLEELTGRGWVDAVHPDDAERYLDAYLQATARRERFEAEFRFRRHDGVYRWMSSVGVPRFEGGVYAGYVGSTSDIHEARLERDREALMALVAHELDQEIGVDERLGRLVRLLVVRGVGDACWVSRVAGGGALTPGPHAAAGAEGERLLVDLQEGSPAVLEVARGGAPLLVPHAPAPTALVPLSARGRTLGVLAVARASGPAYTERDLATLREIGQRAGLAIDNAALYEAEVLARGQAERARRRVAELHALAAVLSNAVSLYDVARAGADAIMTAAGADAVWLVVEAEEPGRLRTARIAGHPAGVGRRFATFPRDAALPIAVAARDGRPVFFEDGRALLERYPLMAEVRADAGAACAVPVGSGALGLAYGAARAFDDAERAHLVAMGRLVGQALARAERFEHEREVSTLLQRSLLPSRLPSVPGLSIARDYQAGAAGTEAGGDWYDALVLADGRVAITVGDVVGRGPQAATVMGQMRSALSAYLTAGSAPALALTQLNEFAAHVDGASGATALCLIFDPEDGRVVWARAGHPPPLVVGTADAGYRETLRGPLLGLIDDAVYEEGSFTLAAGAAVLAYSDGLIERRGGELARNLAALAAIAGGAPRWSAEQLLHAIRVAALPQGGVEDDVVMVVVARHLEPGGISTDADPASLRDVRHSLRDWVAPWALPAAEVDDMVLALGEAIANAAEHAYADGDAGPLEARFWHDPDGEVVMLVSDAGRWRRPADDADRGHRGYGLELMRALMDRVDVVPSSSGTRVELRYRPRPSPAEPALGLASAPSQPEATGVEVDAEHDGGGPIHVRVRGEIDEASAASFADAVLPRLASGRALVIDLSRAAYMGSAALHVIGDAIRRAAAEGVDLSVRVAADSAPHRVLVLT